MNSQRYERICRMMAMRQPDLTLCLEEVHKPHNVSAVIRSADAVGIHDLHAVWPEKIKTLVSSAAGSNSWVNVHNHDTLADAVTLLKSQGMQILATHLSDSAVDFRAIDFTRPTCIIMGSEKTGISAEAIRLADQHIMIPMSGMVQSLNVSVAAAVILYEAQRQREAAGLYEHPRSALAQDEQQRLLFERGYPVLAQVAREKKLPRPQIDEQGHIIAPDSWWAAMQQKKPSA
ncbi:TPA: tRNA (guanosine(18)-2'-O)-methyltransferase TrmH [Morganella morganii]|uniref:tRNA (guanosine(18)-2'-O)-methyltransferase TrmH n=1 Tax=Morganella morganii TaxID=582 RepID=UPI00052B8CFC|nr:tRNA (guanosine(18)-2'-O)-methyltransferase TrmH [Morganella morganii]EKJ0151575.1 tRNA (guanosine(18)-2'-O)-methyltransferase TrmH [Salmonella enterica subsp. enterica serovar Bareilly]KGP43500.1 tRNA guanosine-2'-O-methyltransferase [Morganella morganii]MBT0371493.1 tRNA (guanosine(18)-2'-O)-methyltransferase TrmH [Morganella morganii subsp. morganii]MBT0444443.1 tRNA (guanosine(18)-2'-O)-methyltransferase TrmH [Morganella morganii subsp. morganii]MDW7784384.1 tRNA (guanosine(18)-2'-O)-me